MASFVCIRRCAFVCRVLLNPPAYAACVAACSANCAIRDP